MKTIIIHASSIKESKEIALKEYGNNVRYVKPYKYATRGNNFYEFEMVNTVDGMTIEEYVEKELLPRKTKFWGDEHIVKPVIHPTAFGDGLQLCYLGTINQRPHYWLIRIDSKIDVCDDDFNMEEHLLNPLEDEFGRHPGFIIDRKEFYKLKQESHRSVSDWETYREYSSDCKYPRLDWEGGHWGVVANFATGIES